MLEGIPLKVRSTLDLFTISNIIKIILNVLANSTRKKRKEI